jgi:hypothetical protein
MTMVDRLKTKKVDPEQNLLSQSTLTHAVVWSPQSDGQAVTALSNLLLTTKAITKKL